MGITYLQPCKVNWLVIISKENRSSWIFGGVHCLFVCLSLYYYSAVLFCRLTTEGFHNCFAIGFQSLVAHLSYPLKKLFPPNSTSVWAWQVYAQGSFGFYSISPNDLPEYHCSLVTFHPSLHTPLTRTWPNFSRIGSRWVVQQLSVARFYFLIYLSCP